MAKQSILLFQGVAIALVVFGCLLSDIIALTSKERNMFLKAHNDLRAQLLNGGVEGQPKAKSMPMLKWNSELQQSAQRWANNCTVGHDTIRDRQTKQWGWVGQNWAGTYNVEKAVQMWWSEYQYYNYKSNRCNGVCGHYTQVAWAKTTDVGCAYKACAKPFLYGNSIVCNYGPGGNYIGERPYEAA